MQFGIGAKLLYPMSRGEHRLREYENSLLVGVFGLSRGGVIGGSRKLVNVVPSNLPSSLSIIRMNKSRRLRWEMQLACVGKRGMHFRFSWERQEKVDHYDMCENNIRMALMYCNMELCYWIDLFRDRDQVEGSCEYSNEPSGSIKHRDILEWLND
jgi:hypothetical protein